MKTRRKVNKKHDLRYANRTARSVNKKNLVRKTGRGGVIF